MDAQSPAKSSLPLSLKIAVNAQTRDHVSQILIEDGLIKQTVFAQTPAFRRLDGLKANRHVQIWE